MIDSNTVVLTRFALAMLLGGVTSVGGQTATPGSTLDLSSEQRRALLQERIREHQKLLNERQRASFERQLALQKQLQAQRQLQQAKNQEVWDQYQSGMRQSEAVKAIATESARAESERIEAENLHSRIAMVERTVRDWKPPRGYQQVAGSRVQLSNPFEPEPAESGGPSPGLTAAVRGTFLELDVERALVRVGGSIPSGTCGGSLLAGDYPVLEDGNLLDTAERVGSFLEACADPTAGLFVLRNEQEFLAIERSF